MNLHPCPKCGGRRWVGVEYAYDHPEHYDGVSEWECEDCGARFGRWSGKQLQQGEVEPRWGERRGQNRGHG